MISKVIDWKFSGQEGMRCKEVDGIMQIVEFPGGIPSQADQDLWTQEYADYIAAGGDLNAKAQQLIGSPQMQSAIEEFKIILEAASIPVPADIVGNIVNRCKAKL